MLGGGGLVAVNVYASATDDGAGADTGETTGAWADALTIDCPDVGEHLVSVPDPARADVDRELALLDQQIADAYLQLQASDAQSGSPDDAILTPLTEQRAATIERIAVAVGYAGERPEGLETLAACALRQTEGQAEEDGQAEDNGQDGTGGQADNGQDGTGGQADNGPVAEDYADITAVQPAAAGPPPTGNASRGAFTTSCGVNEGGLFNSDNVIVAPGVTNGAHHFHDYVGNQSNNAFASDENLAAAETSCVDQGDRSSYYWPVLRLRNGAQERDAQAPGGGIEGNAGEIVTPKEVTLTFVGSPVGEVTAMPRLLRIITGDAKAFVNGPGNANASWSCTGFEDRQLKDKYPVCPSGSDVVRSFRFQSCWDGRNIDSANHRTHVAFADASGTCPAGFRAIPQLVQRIVYDVDAPSLDDGGRTTPLFAVDSFPEQLHKPVTDHGDFINVFDEDLMGEMVDCINSGRRCGAGAGAGGGDDAGEEEPGVEEPTAVPEDPQGGDNNNDDSGNDSDNNNGATEQPTDPSAAPVSASPSTAAPSIEPKSADTPTATAAAAPSQAPVAEADDDTGSGGNRSAQQVAAPQGDRGGLAETGTTLWPAAIGSALLIAGGLLMTRTRRRPARS
ncbi:DUF1996 domain-containing protein [Streptomyces sp. NPDC096205]|uniref:DUF1996 domain-containing protein n=1 Tax=Streptomyces sp. NPDC096205 TaxID=3366081 RepID=UPI003803FF6C